MPNTRNHNRNTMSDKPQHGNGRNQTFQMIHPETKQEITVGDWQEDEFEALGYERKGKKPKADKTPPAPPAP
jgi:hypothetical protein